jgi:hypothetical protein
MVGKPERLLGEASMAKRIAKRQTKDTWSGIAKEEETLVTAATNVVERLPAPVDMVDRALVFAARTLKSQREALVPLLDGVAPKGAKARPSAAAAISAAFDLAERIVETQRKLLPGLIEAVTPPLARHAPKSGRSTKAAPAHHATRKPVVRARAAKRAA